MERSLRLELLMIGTTPALQCPFELGSLSRPNFERRSIRNWRSKQMRLTACSCVATTPSFSAKLIFRSECQCGQFSRATKRATDVS